MAYVSLSISERNLVDKYRSLSSDDKDFAKQLDIFADDEEYKLGITKFLDQIS